MLLHTIRFLRDGKVMGYTGECVAFHIKSAKCLSLSCFIYEFPFAMISNSIHIWYGMKNLNPSY